jgi:hypothetical protein
MTPQQLRAIRLVVVLLVASIATSVAFTVLALAVHATSLGGNQILIFVVAALYVWVIRQLRAGSPRAYRRVRIVSAAGFVAVAWQLLSGAYPVWMRPIEGVQLALLAALIYAVNRPVMRAAFPAVPDTRPRNRRAALTLVLLTPLVAEVSLGTLSLREMWVLPVFVPIYGAGALFLREIVRRTGGGLGNLLLVGVAYGLLEEGLALQSLTSPHLYDAAGWAPRVLGVNSAYTELNLVYHPVFSIVVPVILVEFLFAGYGPRPYLRRGGLIASGVIALIGAGLLRVTVPPSEDPGYQMPLLAILIVAVLIAVVMAIGLRVRFHRSRLCSPRGRIWPIPVVAGAAAFAFFSMLWPLTDGRQVMWTHGVWAFLPMTVAGLIVAALIYALHHWSWTARQLVAACVGALVAHSAFGLLTIADSLADRLFLAAVALLTALAGRQALGGRALGGGALGGQALGGQALGGQVLAGHALGGQALGGQDLAGQALGGQALGGQALGGQVLGGQALGSQALGGRALSGQALSGQALGGQALGGQALGRQALRRPSEPAAESLAGEFDVAMGQPRQADEQTQEPGDGDQFDRPVQAVAESGQRRRE